MRIKQLLMGVVASVIAVSSYVEIAVADLKFPMLVYRTGAYAPNGIPNADGFVDYYKMINARDGGIGGEKILHPDHLSSAPRSTNVSINTAVWIVI